MPEENIFLGALIDERPAEAKVKDIFQVELVASTAPVEWKEKKDKDWRKFPEQNQDGSGSCVAQTVKKLGGIQLFLKEGKYVEFSATPIYQARSNRPGGGMIGVEAFDIWKRDGLTLESLVPSFKMNDSQMDAYPVEQYEKDIAKVFAIANHVGLPVKDFETIASTIQATGGKGVMVWFYFTHSEWGQKFPKVITENLDLYASNTARHSVAAVDFGLINGKKYIKIEDSAHFGGISERWISEEFFVARNWFARYNMNFKFQDQTQPAPTPEPTPTPTPGKPKYTFTKPLEFIALDEYGKISDLAKHEAQKKDVTVLQDILRYEGFFPVNVSSTGYFGATTARALYNWQVKHAVAPLSELDSIVPKGGRFGSKSINTSNQIYG